MCPNCYLLGKEIFVFKLLTLLTWLAGYCLHTAYRQAGYILLTVGYEDDDDVITTVTIRYLYILLYVPVPIYKQKSTQYEQSDTHTYTHTLPIHRISLLHIGNFPDPIRYENVPLSFVRMRCSIGVCVCCFLGGSAYLTCLSDFFYLANSPPPRPRALILSGSFTWLLKGRRGGPRLGICVADWDESTECKVSLIYC